MQKKLAVGLLTSFLGACAASGDDGTGSWVAGDSAADGDGPPPSCADRSETYPDDNRFPLHPGPADPSLEHCAPRCGSRWRAPEQFYSTDALPAGTCAPSSVACRMLAHEMCPCPTVRGPVSDFQCSCESGKWSCAIVYRGASTCLVRPADSGGPCAREDGGRP